MKQIRIIVLIGLMVGVLGISSTARAEVQRQTTIHTVTWGETLFRIAQRYDVTVEAILGANDLANPDRILVGQQIVIPLGVEPEADAEPSASNPTVERASSAHTVVPGETLYGISQRYAVPLSILIQQNNIPNASVIYVGQVLTIPGRGSDTDVEPQAPAQQLDPTPAAPAADPTPAAPPTGPGATLSTGKQIVVKLSEQAVYAYEDGGLQRSFIVSTGLPATPTVQGDYAIYLKYNSQWMSGPGYSLPGVPWVMYFYKGYGFHGTYWHSNFGQPMSHGCVNMVTDEARWLYEWAPIGTAVHVTW